MYLTSVKQVIFINLHTTINKIAKLLVITHQGKKLVP